jgi:uncharacterized protein (DUF3084 family)
MNSIYETLVVQLSNLTVVEGVAMTIHLDFWELVSIAISAIGVFCGFQVWCVKTVSTATHTWGEVTGAVKSVQEEVKKLGDVIKQIESDRDDHRNEIQGVKSEIQSVKTEIAYMQTQFLQRIEVLDTLKKTEQFFANIMLELQAIAGKPIKTEVPDLQSAILHRQQVLDDNYATARARK